MSPIPAFVHRLKRMSADITLVADINSTRHTWDGRQRVAALRIAYHSWNKRKDKRAFMVRSRPLKGASKRASAARLLPQCDAKKVAIQRAWFCSCPALVPSRCWANVQLSWATCLLTTPAPRHMYDAILGPIFSSLFCLFCCGIFRDLHLWPTLLRPLWLAAVTIFSAFRLWPATLIIYE